VLVANSLLGQPQLWVLFLASVVFAGVDGLQRPSLDAIVPQIVRPDQLPATSAIMSVRYQLGMIAAPALTGVIIAAGGLTLTYSLDVASYVVSLMFLLRLGAMPPPPGESELSLAAIRAGMSYAWRRKDLLGTYLVDMNAMFFGMPNALFPQIASHLGGASALGVLYASPALGSFVVTATSAWTARVRRHGRMIAVAAGVWGVGIILLGFASSLWVAAIGLVIAGGGDMVSGLGRMTMWNQSSPTPCAGGWPGSRC
jgi:MFS family permease